jgi:hypothetical protein
MNELDEYIAARHMVWELVGLSDKWPSLPPIELLDLRKQYWKLTDKTVVTAYDAESLPLYQPCNPYHTIEWPIWWFAGRNELADVIGRHITVTGVIIITEHPDRQRCLAIFDNAKEVWYP